MRIKLIKIGNSRGVRLPKKVIEKYNFKDELVMEAHEEGVILKPIKDDAKLSWDETFSETAAENEDWSDMDALDNEGLEA
jgi:antitoxin MazE